MKDLYCPRCAEPWDNDTFHDVAEEQSSTYKAVIADFYQRGCEALGMPQCSETHSLRAQASAALRDVLGDDTDGIIAELEDLEYVGLLDDLS